MRASPQAEAARAARAEQIQSITALMIPLSLFLACVLMAAGTFLIYNQESVGWLLSGVSATMIITSFVALIRFQNQYRARGIIRSELESNEELDFDRETVGAGSSEPHSTGKKEKIVVP